MHQQPEVVYVQGTPISIPATSEFARLRLSQKLATKIKAGKLGEMPLDANPLVDWSAHVFVANRTPYFILSNTKSLYSCVMLAKGVTTVDQFIEQALGCIREFMESGGQKSAYRKFVAPACATVSFAKALNRMVTGSMNELIKSQNCGWPRAICRTKSVAISTTSCYLHWQPTSPDVMDCQMRRSRTW